jgi:Fe2+ or Zn2+ uptake regulation protein
MSRRKDLEDIITALKEENRRLTEQQAAFAYALTRMLEDQIRVIAAQEVQEALREND